MVRKSTIKFQTSRALSCKAYATLGFTRAAARTATGPRNFQYLEQLPSYRSDSCPRWDRLVAARYASGPPTVACNLLDPFLGRCRGASVGGDKD